MPVSSSKYYSALSHRASYDRSNVRCDNSKNRKKTSTKENIKQAMAQSNNVQNVSLLSGYSLTKIDWKLPAKVRSS